MGTRYTDELAAWADQKAEKKRRQDAAAVAFLAVRGGVRAESAAARDIRHSFRKREGLFSRESGSLLAITFP